MLIITGIHSRSR